MPPSPLASSHIAGSLLLVAPLIVASGQALAGLSLDEALQRHRLTLAAARSGLNLPMPSTPGLALGNHVHAAVGRVDDAPPLLRPPVAGRAGVQLLYGGGDPEGFAWRLGAGWSDSADYRFNLEGSELSYALGSGHLYASNQRRHWGPGWAGSLILDQGAAPIPAVGWRKTDPSAFSTPGLAWLGPWNLDVFFGTLSGHIEPARPRLVGFRFQFVPLDGLELGVSRVIEWGGRGRSESAATLWKALVGQDNIDGGSAYDPSNQLAGFDVRYTWRLGSTGAASLYGQAIGEDEANALPSRYIGSAGADVAFTGEGRSVRLLVEHANTVMGALNGKGAPGAYRHGIYRQGYTHKGRPLGFPAGGDVQLTTLGAMIDTERWAGIAMFHRGSARAGAQSYPGVGRLDGVDLQVSWRIDESSRVGTALTRWRDPGGTASGVQLWWRHDLR